MGRGSEGSLAHLGARRVRETSTRYLRGEEGCWYKAGGWRVELIVRRRLIDAFLGVLGRIDGLLLILSFISLRSQM